MSISRFYDHAATVIQWTETLNEVGGSNEMTTTYTSISNIMIALEQLSKGERFIDGTDKIIGTHRAYAAITTTITEIHNLIIGTDTYDIKSIENPMQMNHHYEMILELIE